MMTSRFITIVIILCILDTRVLPAQPANFKHVFKGNVNVISIEYFQPRCWVIQSGNNAIVWNIDDSCIDATIHITSAMKYLHHDNTGYIIPIPQTGKFALYAFNMKEGKMSYSIYDGDLSEPSTVLPTYNSWPLGYGRCDNTNVVFVLSDESKIEARRVTDFSPVENFSFKAYRASSSLVYSITIHPSGIICESEGIPPIAKYRRISEENEFFRTLLEPSNNLAEIQPSGERCLLLTRVNSVVHENGIPTIRDDPAVLVYNLVTHSPESTLVVADRLFCNAMFSPKEDGSVLIWTYDGKIFLWDYRSHKISMNFEIPDEVINIKQRIEFDSEKEDEEDAVDVSGYILPVFSSDGDRVIVLTENMHICEFIVSSGKCHKLHNLNSTFAVPVPVQLRQEVRREEEDELKPDH